jgi:hypothetical protein
MQAISIDETPVRNEVRPNDIGRLIFHDYFGRIHQLLPGPQAYLVEHLDPESKIYPHFHDVDQFQVFVAGTGKLGKHAVPPITVHYADGFSPYGPIVANGLGLTYFTLRLASASGGWRMPGNRHLLPARPGRTFSMRFDDDADALSQPGGVARRTLWGPAEDGLEVIDIRIGPDTGATGEAPASGQYVIVCAGSLRHEGKTLPPNSLLFLEPGDPAPSFAAGPDGAALLVLQYPRPTDRPGSNPATRQIREGAYAFGSG